MSSQYNSQGSQKTKISATPEMIELVHTTEICIEGDTVSIFNGTPEPIKVKMDGDSFTANNELTQQIIDTFRVEKDDAVKWIGLLNDLLLKDLKKDPDLEDEDDEKGRKSIHYIHKYSTGIPLAEAILIGDTEPQFLQIIEGKAELLREIELPGNIVLRPLDKWSYLSKEYPFSSIAEINEYIERARKETPDSLYYKIKSEWEKYIDHDDIVICAADTYFSYFQDKLGMTHYLHFIGDNDVGKTSNLKVFQQIAYRPFYNISATAANIYRCLGSIEEGQVTIVEDEMDGIEERDEKRIIYQSGYISGAKVARSDDTSSGRKSQGFYTYGLKAFTSEKQPDSIKGKAFNERIFVIKCSAGDPPYDINEVINPAGDEEYKTQLDELVDIRKLLLVYRLLHHNDPIPSVKKLNIKNRDKQLCKPLIRLFRGTRAEKEILKSLSKLLEEKKQRKANTIDAILYYVVVRLVEKEKEKQEQTSLDKDATILTSASIWDSFTKDVDGRTLPNKLQSIETEEFGTISQKQISSILKDRFGGDPVRIKDDKGSKGYRFSRSKLTRLKRNYSLFEGIRIDDEPVVSKSDRSDASDACTKDSTCYDIQEPIEGCNYCNTVVKNIQGIDMHIANITRQMHLKTSDPSQKGIQCYMRYWRRRGLFIDSRTSRQ